ncbi:maleylpyruvate isomerase family mycothiol-dependent enzyme [Geodermatophilus sp. YIM 151500]|uniref:maleylpyruvate isomerase family mycothiol-dependent enzyme n=1 Tax=Geodermatophilus sp. YIM 151500 TaxID=2984531 RepID=UPI0021E45D3F|nr:maleylpyruvate isomerase family mycothiol-dependent enzyme [Geodermatophilus sp. YIM 151500]MCV2489135.1 maleylpyruvate isomerase family mycothiol-dependent enzyme [Geodermatophilus sp. YIM 151500]
MLVEEYLPALERANRRFADAAAEAVLGSGWGAPVPGCPGWRLADLIWHLSEVQHFWAWVVRTRAPDPSTYVDPRRPGDDELLGAMAAHAAELETVLAGADPVERVWTWAPQQDVAFVLRRQTHEATVHTVDVEQVLGAVRPIPTTLAMDGIDEWLDVMVPGALPDGPPPYAHPVVLHAVDADAERTLFPSSQPFPIAALTGTAGDLLLALWRRVPLEVLTVDGDGLQAAAMIDLVKLD